MYITHEEYLEFGGSLARKSFDRFSSRAEALLKTYTHDRITEASNIVKQCMFELIEYISHNEENGAIKGITSVSNDGYSVSYASTDSRTDIDDIIYQYLADTDLLCKEG